MKNRSRFLMLIAALLMLAQPVAASGQTILLDQSSDAKMLILEPGDSIELMLPSNPSTGFAWTNAAVTDDRVINCVNRWLEEQTGVVGGTGTEHWVFEAVGEGSTRINLCYSRPWESRMPEKTFLITVNVLPEEIVLFKGNVIVEEKLIEVCCPLLVKDDRVLIELNEVAGLLEAEAQSDGVVCMVHREDRSIQIDQEKGTALVGDYIDRIPVYRSGETIMVPVRAVAESLGYKVEWREADKTVLIIRAA